MVYNTFAVAGAGGLGAFIVKHLAAAPNTTVTVLSRSQNVPVPSGVHVKVVDYDSEDSLIEALSCVDVVISSLSGEGFGAQPALFKAAKKAGAKLAVPSEFGNNTLTLPEDSPLYFKRELQRLLQSLSLPSVLLFNGPFTDTTYAPFLGFDFDNKQVTIVGEGINAVPQTTRNDVARFLVHILTTLSPSELENKDFTIQGDLLSFNDAIKIYEETHPDAGKIQVTHTPRSEAEANVKANPGWASFLDYLRLEWDITTAPKEADTAHKLFPDWNATKARQVIAAS